MCIEKMHILDVISSVGDWVGLRGLTLWHPGILLKGGDGRKRGESPRGEPK